MYLFQPKIQSENEWQQTIISQIPFSFATVQDPLPELQFPLC